MLDGVRANLFWSCSSVSAYDVLWGDHSFQIRYPSVPWLLRRIASLELNRVLCHQDDPRTFATSMSTLVVDYLHLVEIFFLIDGVPFVTGGTCSWWAIVDCDWADTCCFPDRADVDISSACWSHCSAELNDWDGFEDIFVLCWRWELIGADCTSEGTVDQLMINSSNQC